jgi:sugar O-acyltransferase (sialic acid O-acetyltransferase NeuD family)
MNAEQQRNPKSLMKKKSIVVIGAGGMAREVRWLIEDLNAAEARYEFLGYVVTDLSRLGEHDSKADVLGDYSWLEKNKVDCVAIGIGTPVARLKVARELKEQLPGLEYPALVHPSAIIDRKTAKIEEGVLVCAGVVATVNITLQEFALCNFGCTLGHEVMVGQGSVINPGANISGGVVIANGAQVSTGAQVLQYLTVGEGATVGAGAVVTKDVPPGVTVVGIPAKELRSKGAM